MTDTEPWEAPLRRAAAWLALADKYGSLAQVRLASHKISKAVRLINTAGLRKQPSKLTDLLTKSVEISKSCR